MIVTDYICQLSTNKIRFRFYNEVKWNLTQLTARRAVACCRSAVSAWWLKRGQPCFHHLKVLCTAFPGGLSLHLACGSFFLFFYSHPFPSFIFPLDKSVWQVPGPIGVGAHGWKVRVYQELACSRRSVSTVQCSDGGSELYRTRRKRGKKIFLVFSRKQDLLLVYLALRILFCIIIFINCGNIVGTVNWTKVVATDGKDLDGHWLKLEKIGPTFLHVSMLCLQKSTKILKYRFSQG